MKSLSQSIRKLFFSMRCSACGEVIEEEDRYICRRCFKILQNKMRLRNIENYYFLCWYDEDIKSVIKDYKLNNRRGLSLELSYLVKKYFKELMEEKKIDIVIPVPISAKRRRERGFNQVEELLEKMKVEYQQLDRIRDTEHMYSIMNKESREKNIKGAFSNKYIDVNGKNLLIVDDIITTGSTTRELIKEIKRKGNPENIYVFAITASRYFGK